MLLRGDSGNTQGTSRDRSRRPAGVLLPPISASGPVPAGPANGTGPSPVPGTVPGQAGGPAPGQGAPPDQAVPLRVSARHLNLALDELLDSRHDLTRVLLGSRPMRGADVVIRPVLPYLRPSR